MHLAKAILWAGVLLACGDDTQTGGAGGSGGAGGGGASGGGGAGGEAAGGGGAGGAAALVSVPFEVRGLGGNLIDGVEICVDGADPVNCATTDATGKATLSVPANSELAFRAQKTSYVTTLIPLETGMSDVGLFHLAGATATELGGVAQVFGVTLDPTKGTVVLLHGGQAPTGVAAAIAPASGDGPFYFDATFAPQPQATELPQGGGALFFNVAPGNVTVSFAPPLAGCAFIDLAWGAAADSTTTPVEANVISGPPNIYCN